MYNLKGVWSFGFFSPWGRGTPNLLFASHFLLTATQQEFQASLGLLFKEMNKTCTYGTEERQAFFSVFSLKSEILKILARRFAVRSLV